ncbi:hypothetical protein COO60DRAFT_1477179 [Scenedesmus sp. NREL 46B-D3]|nr:hypothetical protein COO60DRAFT_1477179 [Scenedesmus sp. NREL 46B-D3]
MASVKLLAVAWAAKSVGAAAYRQQPGGACSCLHQHGDERQRKWQRSSGWCVCLMRCRRLKAAVIVCRIQVPFMAGRPKLSSCAHIVQHAALLAHSCAVLGQFVPSIVLDHLTVNGSKAQCGFDGSWTPGMPLKRHALRACAGGGCQLMRDMLCIRRRQCTCAYSAVSSYM